MKSLALYIHWPFCLSKCPYCDFNSHVRQHIDEQAWQEALLHELKRYAHLLQTWQQPRRLESIFFGGGTPSLMKPQTVETILNQALKLWPVTDNLEITLEANPNSVEVKAFQALNHAGVNRISIGIQALYDQDLKKLGRQHSAAESLAAIETACRTFNRVSFDLIYARPDQTVDDWQTELLQALSFGTEHLSLYQLTIEAGTAFATLHDRGDLVLPTNDTSADLYELTQSIMADHGRPAYEVSNHAKVGAECRHNKAYWRYQDYIGIGPGAHGRLSQGVTRKLATRQIKSPEGWIKSIKEQGHGDAEVVEVSLKDQLSEQLLMGLRLTQGIAVDDLVIPLQSALDNGLINKQRWDYLKDGGYLEVTDQFLKATPAGLQRLQSLLNYFLCIA
ncbi:coproporphyrinogen III oxidase [Candidatus Finniella inopinata]|uniref:Heme chaperone HemW n=1 Tax=Candidatus Finniella inopinata TaxID=1696036 RepID=A0A4Q7DIX9_9PROT|nr:coproporphyrinogen III oxidase [Candidatus Finniella inopinata]